MIEFFQGFCGCKAFEKNIYEDQFIDNLLKNNGNTTKSKPLNEKIFIYKSYHDIAVQN